MKQPRAGFRSSFFTLIGLQGFRITIGFGTAFILGRILGADGLGEYAIALSWAELVVIGVVFGSDVLGIKTLGGLQNGSPRPHSQYIPVQLRSIAARFTVAIPAFWAIGWIGRNGGGFDGSPSQVTLIAAFALTSATICLLVGGLEGLGEPIKAKAVDSGLRPAVLIASVCLVAVLAEPNTPNQALACQVASAGLAAACLFLLFPKRGMDWSGRPPKQVIRNWKSTQLSFLAIAAVYTIMGRTDRIMLGFLANSESAGNYFMANNMARVCGTTLIAVNAIIAPRLIKLHREGKSIAIERLCVISASGAFATSMALGVALAAAGPIVLDWIGKDFGAAHSTLWILLIAVLANVFGGSAGALLKLTGRERLVAGTVAFSALLNALLNLLLIPRYGPNGAAVARLIAVVAWNAAVVIAAKKLYGVNTTPASLRPEMIRDGRSEK